MKIFSYPKGSLNSGRIRACSACKIPTTDVKCQYLPDPHATPCGQMDQKMPGNDHKNTKRNVRVPVRLKLRTIPKRSLSPWPCSRTFVGFSYAVSILWYGYLSLKLLFFQQATLHRDTNLPGFWSACTVLWVAPCQVAANGKEEFCVRWSGSGGDHPNILVVICLCCLRVVFAFLWHSEDSGIRNHGKCSLEEGLCRVKDQWTRSFSQVVSFQVDHWVLLCVCVCVQPKALLSRRNTQQQVYVSGEPLWLWIARQENQTQQAVFQLSLASLALCWAGLAKFGCVWLCVRISDGGKHECGAMRVTDGGWVSLPHWPLTHPNSSTKQFPPLPILTHSHPPTMSHPPPPSLILTDPHLSSPIITHNHPSSAIFPFQHPISNLP